MKLLKLRYFVDIVDCGSISAAARKNFIAQQSMSTSLHNLEDYYGVKLFARSPAFRLTPEGERLYSTAKEVLGLMQDFENSLQTEAPPLVIGLSLPNTPPFLYDLIEYVNTGRPTPIEFRLQMNCDGRGSSASDADVFFGVMPPDGFERVALVQDRLLVAVSQELFAKTYGEKAAEKESAVHASKKLDDLRALPFAILTMNNEIPPFMHGMNIISRSNSSDLATSMCLKGKSANLVAEDYARRGFPQDGTVLFFPIETGRDEFSLFMYYRKTKTLSPTAREFIRATKNFFLRDAEK